MRSLGANWCLGTGVTGYYFTHGGLRVADLSVHFLNGDYCLGPGPIAFEEPFFSFAVNEIAEYSPTSIANAILAVSGTRVLRPAVPSWWQWEAMWEQDDRQILVDDMHLSETTGCWMQLALTCDCQLADVLTVWEAIRVHHPAVWLYGDDSRVYSPTSFIAKWTTEPGL